MTRLDELIEREEAAIYRDLEEGLLTQGEAQEALRDLYRSIEDDR
jgi:hypothetical protein